MPFTIVLTSCCCTAYILEISTNISFLQKDQHTITVDLPKVGELHSGGLNDVEQEFIAALSPHFKFKTNSGTGDCRQTKSSS